MNITLHKPEFDAAVTAPTSKSAAHRALITAALADAPTRIRVTGAGEDIVATSRCLTALGASIRETSDGSGGQWLEISPIFTPVSGAILDCGESGSTLRFMVPVVAALGVDARFLRRGRLPERPMEPLKSELCRHGIVLTDENDGSLSVHGSLHADEYTIAANVSSQYITGLLFALSLLNEPSVLTLTDEIESAPYIDMTVNALAAFAACPARSEDGRIYHLPGRKKSPLRSPATLCPEGDFSGAAFPLAAGAIGMHPVTVSGLDLSSSQGDRTIVDLLKDFGAKVEVSPETGCVKVSPAPLHGIRIDAKQIPDLVPILATVAATAKGRTVISGASRLRLKESDRIATTAAMLRAIGGAVTETDDGLMIEGRQLTGGTADGANDHRIVMSAAIASLATTGDVTILGTGAVAKSYPRFFELIRSTL